MEEIERMQALKQEGFFCSQIIIILGLELQGKSNPDLVRCMNGLAGGLGFCGETCGALTGGACLLGLYAGRGSSGAPQNPDLNLMIRELVNWFKAEYIPRYNSIRCEEILEGNFQNQSSRCPFIVAETFQKTKEILVENGYDLSEF